MIVCLHVYKTVPLYSSFDTDATPKTPRIVQAMTGIRSLASWTAPFCLFSRYLIRGYVACRMDWPSRFRCPLDSTYHDLVIRPRSSDGLPNRGQFNGQSYIGSGWANPSYILQRYKSLTALPFGVSGFDSIRNPGLRDVSLSLTSLNPLRHHRAPQWQRSRQSG